MRAQSNGIIEVNAKVRLQCMGVIAYANYMQISFK